MHAFKSEEGVLGSSSGESIIASVIIKETAKNLAYLSSRLASVLQTIVRMETRERILSRGSMAPRWTHLGMVVLACENPSLFRMYSTP